MATVQFDHVWKRYGDVTAVKDLTLDIQDEEFLVLVGPSGCGKTTALRMIAGLEEISEGTLRIGDRVVNDLAPKDRDVAMVFQSYALYPHMSVYDNLAFGLKLRKIPKAEIDKRVREAAGTIELTNLLDRKPKQLSGGQRQRVALGRAIVREPAVFLMDEPLSNLDAKLRVADAGRDRSTPSAPAHDRRLRHPRPGRGDDDGRPHRGHELRRPAADRPAAGAVRASGQQVRGRLHRQPGDELRQRRGQGRRRRDCADRRQPDPAVAGAPALSHRWLDATS